MDTAIIKNILDIKKHVPGPFYRSKVQVDVHCLRNIKAFSLTEMFEAVLLIQYERINPWTAISYRCFTLLILVLLIPYLHKR